MIPIITTHKGHFSLSVRQKETPPAMPKKSLQRSQKTPLAHRQTTPKTTHSRILQNRNDQKGGKTHTHTHTHTQRQQRQQARRTIPHSYILQKWHQMGFCTYFLSRILRNSSGLRLLLVLKPAVHSFVKQTLRKGTRSATKWFVVRHENLTNYFRKTTKAWNPAPLSQGR
jgi:hypothetical protein